MKNPKFKVGDRVTHKKDLYDQTKSKVTAVEKLFKEVDSDNNFVKGGLTTLETTIPSIQLPYKFDGDTLIVTHEYNIKVAPYEHKSKFYGYAYSVTNSKMTTIFSEKDLRRVSEWSI